MRLFFLQALRSHEGNEAQVCFFIIQLLILKPNEFRSRVIDFVKDNSPEHWTQSDWHTQHMAYHKVRLNEYLHAEYSDGRKYILEVKISQVFFSVYSMEEKKHFTSYSFPLL